MEHLYKSGCRRGVKKFVKYIRSTRQRGQVGQSIAVMRDNLPSLLADSFAGQAVVILFLFLVYPMWYTSFHQELLESSHGNIAVMRDNWRVWLSGRQYWPLVPSPQFIAAIELKSIAQEKKKSIIIVRRKAFQTRYIHGCNVGHKFRWVFDGFKL